MEKITLAANLRSDRGKGAARRLRRSDQIPAVAYGKGSEAIALTVSPKELLKILTGELGLNSVIELSLDGGKQKLDVLVADYQHHPVTRQLLHADFRTVALDRPVNVDVPLELYGKAKGIVMGGDLKQVYRRVPVRCLPNSIPAKIRCDITELGLEENLPAKSLPLPEGVELRLPAERTVASIIAGRRVKAQGAEGEGETEEKGKGKK